MGSNWILSLGTYSLLCALSTLSSVLMRAQHAKGAGKKKGDIDVTMILLSVENKIIPLMGR